MHDTGVFLERHLHQADDHAALCAWHLWRVRGHLRSEHTMLHLLQGMTLLAMEGPSQQGFPVLDLFSRGCIGAESPGGACSRHRLHMQLRMPAPAFYGAMNFSGDLRAWSFTDFTWPDQEHEVSRIVRFAGSDGSELWNFWVMLIYSMKCL